MSVILDHGDVRVRPALAPRRRRAARPASPAALEVRLPRRVLQRLAGVGQVVGADRPADPLEAMGLGGQPAGVAAPQGCRRCRPGSAGPIPGTTPASSRANSSSPPQTAFNRRAAR